MFSSTKNTKWLLFTGAFFLSLSLGFSARTVFAAPDNKPKAKNILPDSNFLLSSDTTDKPVPVKENNIYGHSGNASVSQPQTQGIQQSQTDSSDAQASPIQPTPTPSILYEAPVEPTPAPTEAAAVLPAIATKATAVKNNAQPVPSKEIAFNFSLPKVGKVMTDAAGTAAQTVQDSFLAFQSPFVSPFNYKFDSFSSTTTKRLNVLALLIGLAGLYMMRGSKASLKQIKLAGPSGALSELRLEK